MGTIGVATSILSEAPRCRQGTSPGSGVGCPPLPRLDNMHQVTAVRSSGPRRAWDQALARVVGW